jgi:uncharacterized membrane protein
LNPQLKMSIDPSSRLGLRTKPRTFRGVLLRGLSLLLPPILTVVILVWVVNTVETYVLEPVELSAREVLVWSMADVRDAPPGTGPAENTVTVDGRPYARLASGEFVPASVVDWLRDNRPDESLPATGEGVYRQYVDERFLQPQIVVPVFLCVFILLLYVLGKFLTAGISRWFDWGILRLPIVRKVYAAVKQVTDFVFGENLSETLPAHYRQVVAIEYPRPGLWSVGLVMGEAVTDVNIAAHEPCVTVMLPTSPALFTVKPVMLPQSKTHNINLTIDQALQFIISCGVVLPPHQLIVEGTASAGSSAAPPEPSEQKKAKK